MVTSSLTWARTSRETSCSGSASPFVTAVWMSSAILTISSVPMPCVVTHGVPTRTPEAMPGFCGSLGMAFLLSTIPAASARASASLPRKFSDGLTPWDLSDLVPYRPEYLAGLSAEGYTVPLAQGRAIAHQEMEAVIARDVRRDIGGDVQQIQAMDTDHSNETFKHILLPVWTAAYRYNGKSYRFVVNGQSGRVVGERPWSVWKIAAAVIAALVALAAFLYLADAGGYIDLDAVVQGQDIVIQGY